MLDTSPTVGSSVVSRARGNVEGQLVYAVGDIHGCYDLLKGLLANIATDYAARAAGRRPILIFLGDYVDRGPHSAKVLEALIWLQRRGECDVRLLRGNHEQALMDFLDRPQDGAAWLRFGGLQTLTAYGVLPPDADEGPAGLVRARDEFLERMPAAHLRLLQDLELMVTLGDYAFVHAGVRPGVGLQAQAASDLLWIRKGFVDAPGPFEKVIVHGHTWIDEQAQVLDHRVGVDTGAYATGVLSAVRLEDGQLSLLRTAGAGSAPPLWAARTA